jgi:hypothetical protein
MDIKRKNSNEAVFDYLNSANKTCIENKHSLKSKEVRIYEYENHYSEYSSDVEININISSGDYFITFMNDILCSYIHKSIFWATKYEFQFINNCLVFNHENKKIAICS